MSLPAKQVSHLDVSHFSPKTKRLRRHVTHMTSSGEVTSDHSAMNSSLKTPSIIGLENLKLRPSEEYTVDIIQSHNVIHKSLSTKAPIKAFQPNVSPAYEGRPKATVHVVVVFLKIGEIETIKEYFEADIYIQAKWREPVLDKTTVRRSRFFVVVARLIDL